MFCKARFADCQHVPSQIVYAVVEYDASSAFRCSPVPGTNEAQYSGMVDRQIEERLNGVQPTSLLRAIHAKFFLNTPALQPRRRSPRLELRLGLWPADRGSFNNLGNT